MKQIIADILKNKLATISCEVIDDSAKHRGHVGSANGAGHYQVILVSPLFVGKNLIARHQMVYAALKDLMGSSIHALSIHAKTPDEAGATHAK